MLGNWLKTSLLMAAIMALFGVIGSYMGGASGMMMALVFGGAMNLFAYWFSDKMVLRMYNAQEVDAASAPQFYAMVRELAQQAQLPMPRVYLIDEAQPNAFATGRNPEHAAVAATTGILHLLSARELRGVMAHEKVEKAFFMAPNGFTDDARAFAAENRITLLDGKLFLAMLERLPAEPRQQLLDFATAGDWTTPTCPSCGIKMTARDSKRGGFWGCVSYPKCRGTLPMRAAAT